MATTRVSSYSSGGRAAVERAPLVVARERAVVAEKAPVVAVSLRVTHRSLAPDKLACQS